MHRRLTRRSMLGALATTPIIAATVIAAQSDDLSATLMRLRYWRPGQDSCSHLDQVSDVAPSAAGCEECLATGDTWVHLRMCLVCGHVGCCDDSKNTHATKHFHAMGHPIMRSIEPGEERRWCFVDKQMV